MFKFIVLVSLWALCQTAPHPLENDATLTPPQPALPRPSPINPDVPSDPKPEEKITLINDKNKAQPQEVPVDIPKPKRQTEEDTMNHGDCHNLDSTKNQKALTPKVKDDQEKGIIKRDATNTAQGPKEENKESKLCVGEGCDHSEDHGSSKREADTSRTTESPGSALKGKSKPYVAMKPDTFTSKAKRQLYKGEVPLPTEEPEPEQPDEGDNKKTPKREISDPVTAMDKTRDPNFESEDRKTSK